MFTLKARLLNWRELTPKVHHLEFEVIGVKQFSFTPGQCISVIEPLDGKAITHPYSIASPRDGNRFSLCLNRDPDEIVSTYLFELKPGDEVDIQEPFGGFTLRHPGRRVVFIATGTGVAPFRSMLLDHLPRTQPRITLLFGVRYEEGLLYRAEFEKLAAQYPTFHFIPTLTRPTASWTGRTGRVQSHIDEALALRSRDDISNLDVYVCGLKEMVDDVRGELTRRGFDRKQIIYEEYD
jgi:ferredoxin-NADP reductase